MTDYGKIVVKYKVYDFVKCTVRDAEREIDLNEMVKNNAFLRKIIGDDKQT